MGYVVLVAVILANTTTGDYVPGIVDVMGSNLSTYGVQYFQQNISQMFLAIKMQSAHVPQLTERAAEKSLLCDPGSELRLSTRRE